MKEAGYCRPRLAIAAWLMAGCAAFESAPRPGPATAAPAAAGMPIAPIVPIEPQPAAPVTLPRPSPSPVVERGSAASEPAARPSVPAPPAATGRTAAKPVVKTPPAVEQRAAAPRPAAPPVVAKSSALPVVTPPSPPVAAPPAPPAAAPPMDLKSLETRLKETKAIGVFSKLALKNQIDDLLDRLRAFHQGRIKTSLVELRRSFEMLVMKTLALLQDADPPLASALASSRESIWGILSDPAKFATV